MTPRLESDEVVPMNKTTGTTYGYVRVSTDAQSTAMQLDAMRAAGVVEILAD